MLTQDKPEIGQIRFTVPEQTYETPLDEDPRQRADRAYESLLRARPDLTPALCWDFVTAEEQMLANLVREGAVYVGTIVVRSEAEPMQLASARFYVLIRDAALPRDRPFDAIVEQLAAQDERREISFEEFTAGPALLIEEDVPAETVHRRRLAQVLFAIPERQRIVTLGLATEDVDDWVHFLGVLRTVARTVSFTEPEVPR